MLLVVVLLYSCTTSKSSNDVALVKKITKSEFLDLALYKNAIFLKGIFKNISRKNSEILLYTETIDKKYIFYLKSNEVLPSKIEVNEIAYLDDGILMNNEVFFSVDRNVSNQLFIDASAIAKKDIQSDFKVYSLSHFSILKDDKDYSSLKYDSPKLSEQVFKIVDDNEN